MILGFNCFYSLFRLGSPPDVGGVRIAHHFSFLWCMFYYVVFVIVLCGLYPMFPVSLDCPLLIARSGFSNVDYM